MMALCHRGSTLSRTKIAPDKGKEISWSSVVTEHLASSLKGHTEIFSVLSHLLSITLPVKNIAELPEPAKKKY